MFLRLKNVILVMLILSQIFMACVLFRFVANRQVKITVSVINYFTQNSYYHQMWYGHRDIHRFLEEQSWWVEKFRIAENTYKADVGFFYMYYGQASESVIGLMDVTSWYTKIRYRRDISIKAKYSDWEKFQKQFPVKLSACVVLVRIHF